MQDSKKHMTNVEIARFYWNLPNGEKGRFTAYCSIVMGCAPQSWQNKFRRWLFGKNFRPMTPLEAERLQQIIETEEWK